MAELYRFFNSIEGDERNYQAEDFAQFFKNYLGNGFFRGLGVTANDTMEISVAPGAAMIEGHEYTNTSTKSLTLDLADSTNDRIDRIVLRLDRNTDKRYIKTLVKKGMVATDPKPPSLERNDYIWELSLAQVRVEAGKSYIDGSQIIDERGDIDLCGRVQVAREVGDQINTVDVRDVDAKPDRYAEGISQFYLAGSSYPEIMQGWLDSIGVSPSDFGRTLSSLRAYVHTIGNRTNTGLQTFTLFAWDWNHDYEIYGEWKRANNAIASSVEWGKWHNTDLIVEEITNENGICIKYSSGRMECRHVIDLGSRTTNGSGSYSSPYRTSSHNWTFPDVFISPPTVSGTGVIDYSSPTARGNVIVIREVTESDARFIQSFALAGSDVDINVEAHMLAVGRWR